MSVQAKDSKFVGGIIELDGANLERCDLKGVKLVYSGGAPPTLNFCKFESCYFEFGGAAANTLVFLRNMYGGGFADLVNILLQQITNPSTNEKESTKDKSGP